MKKTLLHFKQFFAPKPSWQEQASHACVVCLTPAEKRFVNLETARMLLRKSTRVQRVNPLLDWTAALPSMPRRGSAYTRGCAKPF